MATQLGPQCTYKNQLQEFTQKGKLPLPVYQTVMQGPTNNPVFVSKVWVNGKEYYSPGVFSQLKAAEQDAARVALSSILLQHTQSLPLAPPLVLQSESLNEGACLDVRPFINEDTTFCKTIVNEYAAKKRIERPLYTTTNTGGVLPSFSSSVVLDGTTYIGYAGRNKKEAEQLAARACILFTLDSVNGEIINDIIKPKIKPYAAVNGLKGASSGSNDVPVVTDAGTNFSSSGTSFCAPSVPSIIQTAPPFVHEFKKPKVEANLTTPIPLITFVPGGSGVTQNQWKKWKMNKKSKKGQPANNPISSVMVQNPRVTQQ